MDQDSEVLVPIMSAFIGLKSLSLSKSLTLTQSQFIQMQMGKHLQAFSKDKMMIHGKCFVYYISL